MSDNEKLDMVKTILEISPEDQSSDELISAYLTLAAKEILSWRYSYSSQSLSEVPPEYEVTQGGAENQLQHGENGIQRTFKYEDMVAYIRAHVIPLCKVM